jgi:hypothetical protein
MMQSSERNFTATLANAKMSGLIKKGERHVILNEINIEMLCLGVWFLQVLQNTSTKKNQKHKRKSLSLPKTIACIRTSVSKKAENFHAKLLFKCIGIRRQSIEV